MPRRRPPRQERARATVADILEATARIIERDGYDALTTNEIARVAGVATGSLYQYFPTKEAVVEALQEAHFEKMGRAFLARMEELETAPLRELVFGLGSLMATSELLNSRLSKALRAVPEALRIPVFMVVQTVEALIISTSQYRPRGLTRQRFTSELAELVTRYI